jgi:Tfp pilus assembly protein PilX
MCDHGRAMRKRLQQEDGIALVMALGMMLVLSIMVFAMISYTTSGQRSAKLSSSSVMSTHYAEAGTNAAYSLISTENNIVGGNPTGANVLGCSGATGPSDCSSPTPKVFCLTSTSCTVGSAGSVSVYGFFSGTNPATYNGILVPASTWLIVSTGYSRNPSGTTDSKTTMSTIKISPLDAGAVASVWNHIFMTAPLVPNVCQADFAGNGMTITSPLYVIGNLCLSGQNVAIYEAANSQAIDLQVGGKLVLSGSGTKVGTDATHKIYSGVVVGGCTTVSVASTTSPCAPSPASPSFNYWVTTPDTFVATAAPEVSLADQAADYAAFDPGPMHLCKAGVTTPGPPLAANVFDFAPTSGEPNNSGSGSNGGTFELLPSSSYSCLSNTAGSTSELTWNNTTKTLTANGSIFIDGNLTLSQSATYTGTAVIEVSGTINFKGNNTAICATSPCSFTNWQGSSSNKSMLTLVSLKAGPAASIIFNDNAMTWQGSLWTQPSSKMTFVKNGVTVEGPISVGGFDATFNNASFQPLPVIKNMPVGAPLPPNTGVTVGPLVVTK